jgi:hypothetical protein
MAKGSKTHHSQSKAETKYEWSIRVRHQSPCAQLVDSIMASIDHAAIVLGHRPFYCCISQGEWNDLVQYYIGGPWLGQFEVRGVPILPPALWDLSDEYVRRATR